ncbi:MAG: hypothetical protein RIK87_06260 [Fuerstiella sp.]
MTSVLVDAGADYHAETIHVRLMLTTGGVCFNREANNNDHDVCV